MISNFYKMNHSSLYFNNYLNYQVCQKRYLYIYDNNGIEIHRLKSHLEPFKTEYLPYHYLLSTCSKLGMDKY